MRTIRLLLLLLAVVYGKAFSQTEGLFSVPDSLKNQWTKKLLASGKETISVDVTISGIVKINPEVKVRVIAVSGISQHLLTSQLLFKLPDETAEYLLPINDHKFNYEWDATGLYQLLKVGEVPNVKLKLRKYRKIKSNKEIQELWLIESLEVRR